jgi:hypothetical protein
MNITVKVDDVSLSTVVDEVFEYVEDDFGGSERKAGERTVAHLVADMIVDRLAQDRDRWYELSRTVTEIKRDVIREAVLPMVEQAIAEPLTKTSAYGDPIGGTTTLREVIVDEARKLLDRRANDYPSNNTQTVLQKIVAEEVQRAFAAEIKDAVARARASVADEIGKQVAGAVAAAMKAR